MLWYHNTCQVSAVLTSVQANLCITRTCICVHAINRLHLGFAHLEPCQFQWTEVVLLQRYKQLEGNLTGAWSDLVNVGNPNVLRLQPADKRAVFNT